MALAPRIITVTVPAGSFTSSALSVPHATGGLVGIRTPGTLSSTACTLEASVDGQTRWLPVYDGDGAQHTIGLGVNRHVVLDPSLFVGFNYVRLAMGSVEGTTVTLDLIPRSLG